MTIGSGVPPSGSGVHVIVHRSAATAWSSTSRAASTSSAVGAWMSTGTLSVRLDTRRPLGISPSRVREASSSGTGTGAPRSHPSSRRKVAPAHAGFAETTPPPSSSR